LPPKPIEKQTMSDSTAFLINDMLLECSKTGTAKRLNSLPFSVCSKTGTVGKQNSKKNQLAYNIAYTPEHTILTIIQGDNLPENINGSTHPTMINKEILSNLYKENKPTNFSPPNSVKLISLDEKSYQDNKLKKSNSKSEFNEYFSTKNLPKKDAENFHLEVINSPLNKPIICFTINKNYDFFVIREHKKEEEIIFSSSENNENFIKFIDKSAKSSEIYTYKVKFCGKSNNEEFFSNEIKLKIY
jgi:membrane carboxypeptidase/penicillin-binding protein